MLAQFSVREGIGRKVYESAGTHSRNGKESPPDTDLSGITTQLPDTSPDMTTPPNTAVTPFQGQSLHLRCSA